MQTQIPTINKIDAITFKDDHREILFESNDDVITITVKCNFNGDLDDAMYIYIYRKADQSIWHGSISSSKGDGAANGSNVLSNDSAYLCVKNSLRNYLADLLVANPYEIRVLEALKSVNAGADNMFEKYVENFLRFYRKS